jgi:ACR3 family arsenite efflux pump ArsB
VEAPSAPVGASNLFELAVAAAISLFYRLRLIQRMGVSAPFD